MKMKQVLFLWAALMAVTPLWATGALDPPNALADFTNAEYFIDNDPGIGSGTNLSLTVVDTTQSYSFYSISAAGLPKGRHLLGVRYRDGAGHWSGTMVRWFDVAGGPQITSAEQFLDNDPGQGNGQAFDLTDSSEASHFAPYPTTTFAPGSSHELYTRYRLTEGTWSGAKATVFRVSPNPLLTTSEYFVDTDPGEGFGNTVDVPDAESTSFFASVAHGQTQPGTTHLLSVRYRAQNGAWTRPLSRVFRIAADPVITTSEYFMNNDPGGGNGTALDVPDAAETSRLATINAPNSPQGLETFYLRYRTSNGVWSAARGRSLRVNPPATGGVNFFAAGEMYFDTDPGPGNGFAMQAVDGNFDELEEQFFRNHPMSALAPGVHQVCARGRDAEGRWTNSLCNGFVIPVRTVIKEITSGPDRNVRLTWGTQPTAASYEVHRDSVVTGPFTSFQSVNAPDTSLTLGTPATLQFYYVLPIVPADLLQTRFVPLDYGRLDDQKSYNKYR